MKPELEELAVKAFSIENADRDEFSTGSDDVMLLSCTHEPLGPANDSDYESDDDGLTMSQMDFIDKSFPGVQPTPSHNWNRPRFGTRLIMSYF